MLSIKGIAKTGLMALLLAPALAFAQAQWEEGTHYRVVSEKASNDKRVTEVFSYWCPACYNFESIMKELKTKQVYVKHGRFGSVSWCVVLMKYDAK